MAADLDVADRNLAPASWVVLSVSSGRGPYRGAVTRRAEDERVVVARATGTTPTVTARFIEKKDGYVSSDGELIFLDDVLVQHAGWLRANTELSIRTDLRPTYVVGHAATLNRAVAALIDHARCNAASAIELVVYRRDGQAVITVRDDGPQIAVANSDLKMAARIIAAHGGALAVGERGTYANTVSVRLPSTRQSWRDSAAPSRISGGV